MEDFTDLFNKISIYVGAKYFSETESNENCLSFSKLILDFWPKKYLKEVLGSYFLATKGQLFDLDNNTIKVFPIIDIRTCSEYLNAFDRHFNKSFEQELKSQKFYYEPEENKITEKEIQERFYLAFENALKIVKSGAEYNIAGSDLFIYSELKSRGIINLTKEQIENEIKLATDVYKNNLKIERYDPNTSFGRSQEIKHIINSILPDDVKIINIAKRKVLNDYLKKFVSQKLTIKDILK